MPTNIVIRGGTLIDGTGRDPLPASAVVLEDDRILTVGPEAEVNWPTSARIFNADHKTVLPGFIDAHAHMVSYEYDLEERLTTPASLTALKTIQNLQATLAAGVTTVRDPGGIDAGIKRGVEMGLVPGPRLLICIAYLAPTGEFLDLHLGSGARLDLTAMHGRLAHFCNGVDDVRRTARALLLAGADVIKLSTTGSLYEKPDQPLEPQFTLPEIEAAVYEAHAAGKRTMAHAEGGPGLRNAVAAGIDSIEHGFYLTDADIELMLESGTFLVPTLSSPHGVLKVAERHFGAAFHDQAVRGARKIIADQSENFRKAAQVGVPIAMGSDSFGSYQGENLFELELMFRFGFSPMQAIVAGTQAAAQCLGVQDRLGTLEPEKIADLLVVDGDPLVDITLLQHKERLVLIMKEGKVIKDLLSG